MSFIYDKTGNDENRFPKFVNDDTVLIREVTIHPGFHVTAPSGTDNYFVLACESPIQNAALLFNQKGVNTSVSRSGVKDSNPLEELLDLGNEGTRGGPSTLPGNWSLQRIPMLCTYQ